MTKEDKTFSLLLGAAHFFVDFACTALLAERTGSLPWWQVTACAVLYNGLAFAFQLPVGALGDRLKLSRDLAALGCLLVAVGGFIPMPLVMCAMIGLGNACFHAGGGREALKRGGRKAAIVGRFVAPGAIGIFLGPRLGHVAWLTGGVLPGVLLFLGAALYRTRKAGREAEKMECPGQKRHPAGLAVVCICMFLTVLLRSYMGTVLAYPFLSDFGWALGFTLCIFGGKYFGGILADRFGPVRFCAVSQILATALFMLSVSVPALGFPAVFLFNTTMAVTAARLYRCVPQLPGTMFGLTTVALYLGALPRLLGVKADLFHPLGLMVLGLGSAVLLVLGLTASEGGDGDGSSHRKSAHAVACSDAGD